jgi:hypothetical protein
MFSPLNDPQVEQWFQRLNAPLRRLSVEERAELHSEVRQHLEALVAANEELGSSRQEAWEHALAQFGDPTRIGRRLAWEWRRGKGWVRSDVSPDMGAVLYGLGASTVAYAGISRAYVFLCTPARYGEFLNSHKEIMALAMSVAFPILMGLMVGRKCPMRALTGALYAALLWPALPLAVTATDLGPVELHQLLIWECSWLTLSSGAAYLASVTKRGWYRPSWADFNLTLPRRRLHLSR